MAVNDILEVTDVQTLHGRTLSNVWHYRVDKDADSGEEENLNDLADAFRGTVITNLKGLQSTELNHTCVKVQRVHPTVGPARDDEVVVAGTASGEAHPVNVAWIAAMYTGTFTKKGRGRKFFIGLPEEYSVRGNIEETYIASIEAILLAMSVQLSGLDNGDYTPCVWSRDNPIPKPLGYFQLRTRLKGLRPRTLPLA